MPRLLRQLLRTKRRVELHLVRRLVDHTLPDVYTLPARQGLHRLLPGWGVRLRGGRAGYLPGLPGRLRGVRVADGMHGM